LARVAVLLETRCVVPRLVIEQHEVGAAADLDEIAERAALAGDRPAVHADPEAVRTARAPGDLVEHVPDFDAALVIPLDPLAVDRIIPIPAGRQRLTGFRLKLARAVLAIANARPAHTGPVIIGEALGMRAFDDLGQQRW